MLRTRAMLLGLLIGAAIVLGAPASGQQQQPGWTAQDSGTSAKLNDVSCVDAQTCYAVGQQGAIVATTDGGITWVPKDSGVSETLYGVSCTGDGHCHAVGGNAILATTDGGETWTRQQPPPAPTAGGITLRDVACTSQERCFAVGHFQFGTPTLARLLVTRDGGETWRASEPPEPTADALVRGVSSAQPCTAHAVGGHGYAVATTDGGVSWRRQATGTQVRLRDVHFTDPLHGHAVGDSSAAAADGTILVTSDGGATWRPQTPRPDMGGSFFELVRPSEAWTAVSFADRNNGLVVGMEGATVATTDGGQNWEAVDTGTGQLLAGASMPNPEVGYAVGGAGTILRFHNPDPGDSPAPTSLPSECPETPSTPAPPVSPPETGDDGGDDRGRTVWVNSTADGLGAGLDAAREACTATDPEGGPGTCTLRRALRIANHAGGATIRFDHEVFTATSQPTRIPIDPARGTSEEGGHFRLRADGTTIDAEPKCADSTGAVRECNSGDLDNPADVDHLRPRVWLDMTATPISEGCPAEGCPRVGRHGLLQLGGENAPSHNNTVRGLLISGTRAFRGAIEVLGQDNLIQHNVLADNTRAVYLTAAGDAAGNQVASNHIGAIERLELQPNADGVVLTGAGDTVRDNLIEAFNVGVDLSAQGQSEEAGGPDVRGNVVTGNVLAHANADRGSGDGIGILLLGRGNRIGGSSEQAGNRLSGWQEAISGWQPGMGVSDTGVETKGVGTFILGNRITGSQNAGIHARDAAQLRIGGTAPGEGNVITGSGGAGIRTMPGSSNRVLGNTITGNAGGVIAGPEPEVSELAAGPQAVSGQAVPGALVEAYAGADDEGRAQAERLVGRALAAGNGRFVIEAGGLEAGEQVAVTVTRRDGTTSAFSEPVQVGDAAAGGSPPAAPANVTATGTDGAVELDWDPVDGAAGYEVHRLPSSGVEPAPETFHCVPLDEGDGCVEVTDNSFDDQGLPKDVDYHYRVVAYDAQGRRSAASPEVSAAATTTSDALRALEVTTPDTCPEGADDCLSIWHALNQARKAPLGPAGVRAVITFDPDTFKASADGGPTRIDGCCLDLATGGIVIDGDRRVALHHDGSQGARGVLAGLDPSRQVSASDDNVVRGLRLSGFGTAVSVTGVRNAVGQPGAGNTFAGNELAVDLAGSHNAVMANRVADAEFRTGSAFRSGSGMVVGGRANRVGGSNAGEGNVVVNNLGVGVALTAAATDNEVVGNHIGVTPSGTRSGNLHAGVQASLGADGNRVRDNAIVGNFGPGVEVGPVLSGALAVTGNRIHANRGLGIDVAEPAASCDDRLTPPPALDQPEPRQDRVTGTACPGAQVEVFAAAPDGSGAGQGRTPLGTSTADAQGAFSFTHPDLARRPVLTATATRDGATSPFAANVDTPNVFPPGKVAGLAADAAGDRSVELTWRAPGQGPDGGEPAQRYEIRQSAAPLDEDNFADGTRLCAPGECTSGTLRDIGDPVSFTVTDLVPGRTYHWAVRAVDDDGLTGPVAAVSLSLDGLPTGGVDDLAATAVSPTEVELSFSATGQNADQPPPAGDYVIKQSTGPLGDLEAFQQATSLCEPACSFEPGQVGEPLTFAVSGLTPDTTYFYAVRARGDDGELGPVSNVAEVTTPAGTPGTVDDLEATAISGSEILLRFSAVGTDDGPPVVGDYVVKQSPEPIEDVDDFDRALTLCGETCSFEPGGVGEGLVLSVGDLRPQTEYHYAIRARGIAGDLGGLSNPASAVTHEGTPGLVTDLTVRVVSDTEVELSFSAVGSDGATPPPVGDYVIKQSAAPIEDAGDFEEAVTLCGEVCAFEPGRVGDALSLTVGDLRPGTTYHYAIRARNEAGSLGPMATTASVTSQGREACPGDVIEPAQFADRDAIPAAHLDNVDCAVAYGIVLGFEDGTFRPGATLRRDQMGSFIARALQAAGVVLPEPASQRFDDVAADSPHKENIERLAAAGVVAGGPGQLSQDAYGPGLTIRRDQMASFLVRAAEFARKAELTAEGSAGFDDVPAGNVHGDNIDSAAAHGLAEGSGTGEYHPQRSVRRDQTATFVSRLVRRLMDGSLAS